MDITIKIDIEKAIVGALAPEKLEPILDKHVTEAITSAIRDATDYSSDFRKALSEQFKDVLPHGLGKDDTVKFQHILNQALQSAVAGANLVLVQNALSKAVMNTLPTLPATVTMKELLEMARSDFCKEDGEAFYAYFEESDTGGGSLYLDSDESPGSGLYGKKKARDEAKYSAENAIHFTKEGEVYSMTLDGNLIKPASMPTVISAFDTMLMSLYVGRTRIVEVLDDDDVRELSAHRYDD
ncbi:hypothetical protein E2K99_10265 [Herbaspirillum huttiense]|uniref:hypothetical protein n=1 Tax=Herbaspirillum huttiense TaxID=863372 RepID=UPI001064BEBB|nr:hypothetical protein [Herbaspirillum huttiense]QBP75371.1 hypothetical protein E2K99_10265 [Herbaspirillum huttiense]